MSDLNDRICQFGQKRDENGLQSLIASVSTEELSNFVKSSILHRNFPHTWNYILSAFQETSDDHQKRFQLVRTVLKELNENDVSLAHSNALMQRSCIELRKFRTEHILQLCSVCLESIQSRRTIKLSWKELLPDLLNVIIEREHFVFNEVEYTGTQYKTEFINTICMSTFSPEIITSLTSIFRDIPLSKEEHLKIVNKFSQYIEKLTPHEIPSFTYQLLQLCAYQNSRIVFLRLQHYFQTRIYNNTTERNSDSLDLDAIDSTHEHDCLEAESTVLYHIHTCASLGQQSIRDYMLGLKSLLKAPELILNPFQLLCLVTISTVSHYEETVFEIIRMAVVRVYQEEQKRNGNCWFNDINSAKFNVEDVFKRIIDISLQDRYKIITGLVNFAFILLKVGAGLGRDLIAEKQWHLGNMILFKIFKGKRQAAPTIIQTISNRIISGQNVSHYVEFMYLLTRNLPFFLIENQSCLVELMESLPYISNAVESQVLDVFMPLTKVSLTIRDHLIISLRKALHSRVIETRQMAVKGFLRLLTSLKISNLQVLSDSSCSSTSFLSNHSLSTQIFMNPSSQRPLSDFNNEALCLEVLRILKHCFMQQTEVRMEFYGGLYEAVCLNPELGIPVLNIFWSHCVEFLVVDEDQLPPLDFKKIIRLREVDVVLEEPLGKLLYSIGLIANMMSKTAPEDVLVMKFITILNKLCDKMTKCDLVHFELDDGVDLLDIVPESQAKAIILKEVLNVYEALIGYKISSWDHESLQHAQDINDLFKAYTRFQHFYKNPPKAKKDKDATKKKKDQNKTSQSLNSTASTTKRNTSMRPPKSVKSVDTIIDLRCVIKALKLLHLTEVDFTSTSQANVIKSKCDIHRHFMQTTTALCLQLKNNKVVFDRAINKAIYDDLTEIGRILYTRIIRRFKEFLEFDNLTAVLALEAFQIILQIVFVQYKKNIQNFLCKIGELNELNTKENLVAVISEFVGVFEELFDLEDDENDYSDPELKGVPLIVVSILNLLVGQVGSQNIVFSNKLLEWLDGIVQTKKLSNKITSSFMGFLFDCDMKYRKSFTIYENLVVSLGDVMGTLGEEHTVGDDLKIVNEGTVSSILLAICSSIKNILEDIEAVIARLRSEYSIITYPSEEDTETRFENLRSKEKTVSTQLCFIVTILTNVCNLNVQPGNTAEAIFKNISLLFCTMNSFTKYFILRCSKSNVAFQTARFEKLVKYTGKQLAPIVYKLITHIEESQKQVDASQSKRKHVDSNSSKQRVLKETRLIPKTVYEMEQFSKSILQLSNETKFDLSKYMGQGTVRDFRIMELKEVLEQNVGNTTVSTQSTDPNSSTDSMDLGASDENVPPPKKRTRK